MLWPANERPIAPLAAASEVVPKKSKKQRTAKDVSTNAATDLVLKPSTTVLDTTTGINPAAVTSKISRKRAADFLSHNEEVDVPTNQPMMATTALKLKKKKSKATAAEKTMTEDIPALEAVTTTADSERAQVVKPKENFRQAKLHTSEKSMVADEKQASGWPNEKTNKAVQKSLPKGDSLTADGVNGVLEYPNEEEIEVATTNEQSSTSMQAEAQRTVDKEMADEVATDDESDETGAALLAGFDSDGEDPTEDSGLDPAKMKDLELSKRDRKKLRQAVQKGSRGEPGTVYVGRIPHGFHESEMGQYFSQFGTITNLRLSRNRKTGASKHFAFVEFESDEVAKIVAQTMDNYLMFGHILKCKYAPAESLHPDVWKGANKRFKKVPFNKIEKRKLEEPKTRDQWVKKIAREQGKRAKKAEKVKSMGYEYDLPQIQTVEEGLEKKKLAQNTEAKAIEPATEAEPTGAIEPPNGVPKDHVALAKERKLKKSKKDAVSTDAVPEPVAEARVKVVEPKKAKKSKKAPQESTTPAVSNETQTESLADVATPVKSKKSKKKDKKLAPEAGIVPAQASSSMEPPKFAFHPDEIKGLIQAKSKKEEKAKGTDQVAVQIQLNAELNGALKPTKEDDDESDAEIAATAAVLPTLGGGKKKQQAPGAKVKKERRKSDVLSESAGIPKELKKGKKSVVA